MALPEENEAQVEVFLRNHPDFTVCELPESIPERYRDHRKLGLQLLPSRDETEGFYFCRMKRREL